jgi:heme/copper-type cytochrome/quinol oxidase subunit 4
MSENPPPLPPTDTSMKSRWIAWIVACCVLPLVPLLLLMTPSPSEGLVVSLLVSLILAQLVCSIYLALGLARKQGKGTGAIIGFSIVFMMASVAVGTAVVFVGCLGLMSAGALY